MKLPKPLTAAQIDALPAPWKQYALRLVAEELRLQAFLERDAEGFDPMRTIYPTSSELIKY